MKIVELIDIDLLASSVTQAAHDNFTMAGSWDTDDLVYVINESDDATPRYPVEIYISLEDANTGNYPSTSATKWSLVGASNRWEMFDGYVNTQTEDTDDIEVEIDNSLTNYAGLFKLQGLSVTLSQVRDTELITDGDVSTDSFEKDPGWTYDDGNDEYDCDTSGVDFAFIDDEDFEFVGDEDLGFIGGGGSEAGIAKLYQDISVISGVSYLVKFTVKNYVSGTVAGLAGGVAGTYVDDDGDYVQVIVAGYGNESGVVAAEFVGSVTDISIMKISKHETVNLKVDYPVNYWNYFFGEFFYKEDIGWEYPHYSDSKLRFEIATQAGTAKCGMVAIGKSYDLGNTKYDPQIGIADYSKKDTDSLGRTYLAQGAYAKTLEIDAWFLTSTVDFVDRRLTAVRGIPSILDANNTEMVIGNVESMIVYGFFRDFRITIPGPTKSKCSIEYEGLI